ncbi:unnamed protein product [Ceutorhynchus assimilis]|uniref:HECT domain-containing protein n=1 Tax=Ceutorhynchus assimilis TaxID=467358 RepID=A0A9N9QG91_9CUCU|nr:unnamed protein product [Ceutorhynchus assimilis]
MGLRSVFSANVIIQEVASPSLRELETEIGNVPAVTSNIDKLLLHRGHIFEELVETIKTHREMDFNNMTIEVILPNGRPEAAEDFGGVFRDSLSEFWSSFYEKCTEGTDYKVPIIRHDFGEQEWKAIATILKIGFLKEKYFPIKLAPTFMSECLGETYLDEDILNDFLKYLNQLDKDMVTSALNNFEEVDNDDLITLCDTFKSKWIPSKDNFRMLIQSIAQQEIIQKPAFVSQCFKTELIEISSQIINLKEIYIKLEPSAKNVIAALELCDNTESASCNTENTKKIYGFLVKYIKESDEKIRSSFLRFCTGSNLITNKIKVEFIESDGFARAPIGHTCTNLLQLPNSYENYVVFRKNNPAPPKWLDYFEDKKHRNVMEQVLGLKRDNLGSFKFQQNQMRRLEAAMKKYIDAITATLDPAVPESETFGQANAGIATPASIPSTETAKISEQLSTSSVPHHQPARKTGQKKKQSSAPQMAGLLRRQETPECYGASAWTETGHPGELQIPSKSNETP